MLTEAKMVKVQGTRAPDGFGLTAEEIDQAMDLGVHVLLVCAA